MTWTLAVNLDGANVTAGVLDQSVRIGVGRQTLYQPFQPSTLVFEILLDSTLGTFTANNWQVGDPATVTMTPAGYAAINLFSGSVTDVRANFRTAQVTCVANGLAAAASSTVGTYTPYASEALPGAVLTEIFSNGSQYITWQKTPTSPISYDGPDLVVSTGTNKVYGNYSGQNLLAAMQTVVAAEQSGILYERISASATDGNGNPKMEIVFEDRNDRTWTTPDIGLGSTRILLERWGITRTASNKVNRAIVTYNNGTETSTSLSSAGLSQRWYSVPVTVPLVYQQDAIDLGRSIVGYRRTPGWTPNGIDVPFGLWIPKDQNDFLTQLEVSKRVQIPALITGAPTDYFLEGFDLTLGRTMCDAVLYLSDKNLTVRPQRWMDVSGTTWATVTAGVVWDDLFTTTI